MSVKTLTGKAQADGAQDLPFDPQAGEDLQFFRHTLQVEVRDSAGALAVPAAGSLAVAVRVSGATQDQQIGTIDLTAAPSPTPQAWQGLYRNVRVTPTGLDADKTYSVFLVSGRE